VQMKLFYATGPKDEIKRVEDEVARWLQSLPSDVEVKHVSSAITAAPTIGNNRPLPSLVITVWWEQALMSHVHQNRAGVGPSESTIVPYQREHPALNAGFACESR
jgi:hypothetical protein